MANVEKLEDKLLELIQHNNPLAIALTGEWGIGKTYLWKEFYKDNKNNFVTNKKIDLETSKKESFIAKKYAYISLFGLDSLESLKLAIATEVQTGASDDSPLNIDISKHFKKLFGFVGGGNISASGDMRFGINIGNKLITNIIMSHLKDTLICLDDIERKSDSLPMSEILGLVNYLKNERNCQVIMILHDEESEDKVDFDTQKEKVFDEILVLNDSLSMVKETVNDDEIFPIYEKFYQTMGVRNLRFYQRVQKIYQEIIKHSSSLSKLSKEEILRQILIIKLVNDIPKVLDVDMKELEMYFSEDGLDDRLDIFLKSDDEALKTTVRTKKDDVEKKLSKFYPNFRMEGWTEVVIELITNIDIDSEKFKKLLNQDLINEQALKSDREKRELMSEYHSLNPEKDFNQRLFDNVTQRIDIDKEDLNNLSFHCNILRNNDAMELADELKERVETYINNKVLESPEFWDEHQWYSYRVEPYDIFYDYLVQVVKQIKQRNDIDLICEAFKRFYQGGYHSEELYEAMRDIQENDLKAVIWQPIDNEKNRKQYIRKTLQHPVFRFRKILQINFINEMILSDKDWIFVDNNYRKKLLPIPYQYSIFLPKSEEVRHWTLKLLQKRVIENPSSKAAIENWLEYSDKLKSLNT